MRMQVLSVLPLMALAACSAQPAAQPTDTATKDGMAGMDMAAPSPNDPPSTAAYKRSMASMMQGASRYTGDADVDFMQQMKVHHLAAIAMAETELTFGKDAEARRLASAVIAAQRAEVAQIDRWLAAKR
ncbi:MAG TPA: DUF305 domain-containing protein [Sphingomonas sp.]|nr:DUF305 domain-containing protein [Sphingomonas sp.]